MNLESRIKALEKQVRRQRWVGAAAALCVVAILTMGVGDDPDEIFEVLRAKNVMISNAEGSDSTLISKSGVLFFNDETRPMALYSNIGFTLFGRDGDVVASISHAEDHDGATLKIRNRAGELVDVEGGF